MSHDEIEHEPVAPGTTEQAEGKTNQPDGVQQDTQPEGETNQPMPPVDGEERVLTDEEQVAMLNQTPNSDLAVDPSIEQPSQDPNEVVESDPGAEDEE